MMSGLKWIVLAIAAFVATSGQAQAALIATDPVPKSVTVVHNGLRWAWASPVASQFWGGGNELKVPSFHAGWRYATAQEMLSIPPIALFQALAGGAAAAAPYWNTVFTHVDPSDYNAGNVLSVPDGSHYESLYVTAVPEPSSIALLGLGAVGLVLAERRRRRRARDA